VLVFIFLQAKNGQPYPLVLAKIACGDIDNKPTPGHLPEQLT
jgi:hypothetical protein